jgi:hypothetical protein
MPWDYKVLETNNFEKVKQWCKKFERHGEDVGKMSE